jgi:hypothetical protein
MVTFDVTVDFAAPALSREIVDAMRNIPMLSLDCRWPLLAVVYADNRTYGCIFAADEELPELGVGDLLVAGDSAQELTEQLRALRA